MHPVPKRRGSVFAQFTALVLLPLAQPVAQDQTQKSHWESVSLHSGMQTNSNPIEGVVYRGFVTLSASTPWLQLAFTGAVLPKGSYVRIVSVQDGDTQVLNQAELAKGNNMSAYFNGNAVMVELVAGPNTAKTFLEIDKAIAGDAPATFPPVSKQFPAANGGGAPTDAPEDECAGAIPVFVGGNGTFTNVGATTSAPTWPCGAGGRDIWFRLTAPCLGTYTFTTCTASRTVDTVLQVFDGSGGCGGLFSLGCNDDAGGSCGLGSTLAVGPLAAGTYFIRVGGFGGAAGNFDLLISSNCTNDECSQQFAVGLGTSGPFVNANSTTSFTWPCGAGANDVWFSYAAPSATVTIDTCGSLFDTTLQVFSGTCGSLVSRGCNDDACGLQSRVIVNVTTPQTLFFRVGGFAGATGIFNVTVSQVFPNDECSGAIAVDNGVNGPFGTTGCSTSFGWPCAAGGNDLWYVYQATCTGILTVSTCTAARTYDTCLQIFAGSCGGLTSLGCNDDTGGACGFGSTLGVPVFAGTTYYIRLGGFNGAMGTAELNISCAPNDECAQAVPLALGVNGTFNNANATASAVSFGCGSNPVHDLWFFYDATCTAPHTFSTCTANRTVDTVMKILDGCGGTVLGCNDDQGSSCTVGAPPTNFASRITANLVSGSRYFIAVGGFSGATGNFDIKVEQGTGSGAITTACAGCGPMTISVTGAPHIGGTISTSITLPSGAPFVGLGFGPFCPPAFCGTCRVGHSWSSVLFGTTNTLIVPCNPAFIGIQVGIQGAGFFTPGGCANPSLSLTDTVVATIG